MSSLMQMKLKVCIKISFTFEKFFSFQSGSFFSVVTDRSVNLRVTPKKFKFLKNAGRFCNSALSFYENLEVQLSSADFSQCPRVCAPVSLPSR